MEGNPHRGGPADAGSNENKADVRGDLRSAVHYDKQRMK